MLFSAVLKLFAFSFDFLVHKKNKQKPDSSSHLSAWESLENAQRKRDKSVTCVNIKQWSYEK